MNNIIKNFFYQASYQVLLIFLPIITVPIVSRALGPTGIGTWNYINSILTYFTLVAGLGLSNYGVREIALVRKSKNLSMKFWELQLFNCSFGILIVFIYILFCLFVPKEHKMLYFIQGFALLGSLFDVTWFFGGLEQFKQITIRSFIVKIISFVLIILLVKKESDLVIYFYIQSLSVMISEASLWFFIKGKINFCMPKVRDIYKHFKPALSFFIPKISQTIYFNLTKTILGLMTSMAIVGYYSNANLLIKMVTTIILSLNTVLLPRMTSYYGDRSYKKMILLLRRTIDFQLFLTIPMSFGIVAINSKMINWFFGPDFAPLESIVPILAPIVVLQTLHSGIATQYLVPTGNIKSYNFSAIMAAIISVILNVTLIPLVGIYGASISYLFSQIVLVITRAFSLKKNTQFKFEWKNIIKYVFSALLMYFVIFLSTQNMSSSFVTTLTQIFLGIFVYALLTAILKVNPLILYLKK